MRVVSLLFHDIYLRDPAESGFSSQAADRYKLPLHDFDAQLAGLTHVRSDAPVLFDGSLPPVGDGPPFAITVDDGGVSYHTLMADRLEARGWRGHCFVTTDYIGKPGFLSAAQIRELDARGHRIGTHTASHPFRFSSRPVEEMRGEWSRSRALLEDLLGHAVETASVPGGYFSPDVARTAAESGLRVLFTSEPVTAVDEADGCALIGRFTLRCGCAPDASAKLVRPAPWTRYGAWTSWNAKGLVKPLLGNAYVRVADWVSARKAVGL